MLINAGTTALLDERASMKNEVGNCRVNLWYEDRL